MPGIIVDIGTGDGKFAYELAKANPVRFVIGIDANHASLQETSGKIYKKKEKGGLKNALFVLSSVQDLPQELNGVANQVFINFPWGSLLKSIVLAEPTAWNAIRRICAAGAIVDILLGYSEHDDQKTTRSLPALGRAHITQVMQPALGKLGFTLLKLSKASPAALKNYPSSWSKKLAFTPNKDFYYLRLKILPTPKA